MTAKSILRTLTLGSPLNDLLTEALNNKGPKSVVRFNAGGDREIAFVAIISDTQGYLRAIEAYEQGRDDFVIKAVNAVLDHVRKNGVPEKNSDLNLHLHS